MSHVTATSCFPRQLLSPVPNFAFLSSVIVRYTTCTDALCCHKLDRGVKQTVPKCHTSSSSKNSQPLPLHLRTASLSFTRHAALASRDSCFSNYVPASLSCSTTNANYTHQHVDQSNSRSPKIHCS